MTDYAPSTNQPCPDVTNTEFVRVFTPQNQSLHSAEKTYIDARDSAEIAPAWLDWLGDGDTLGYDIDAFKDHFPRIGIAIPGGGLRSAQFGAGALNALDARNDSAKAAHTGGLLQVASYITGLSGMSPSFLVSCPLLNHSAQEAHGSLDRSSSTTGQQ